MGLDANPRTRAQTVFFVLMSTLALASLQFSCYALYVERERIANGYGDYVIYYTGAQIVRDGAGSDLYDLSLQRQYQAKFAAPIRAGALPFNHPAYELLWHIPLTFLSYVDAYVVWNLINAGLLLGLVRWFALRDHGALSWMCLIMAFGFYPVLAVLLHGQDSILLTCLIGASMLALKRQAQVGAGVLLALASFKPQLVLPIALTWMCRPYRKAAVAWLVSVLLLGLLSVSMVGITGTVRYLDLLSWIDKTNYTISPAIMPNLRGMIHLLLGKQYPNVVFPLTALLTLGVLVLMVRLWRRFPSENEQVFDLTVALTVTLTLLTSYHGYAHDFALLLLPALIATRGFFTGSARGTVPVLLGAVLLILWIPFPFTYGQLIEQEKLALGALVIVAFAALLAMQLKLSRAPSST